MCVGKLKLHPAPPNGTDNEGRPISINMSHPKGVKSLSDFGISLARQCPLSF